MIDSPEVSSFDDKFPVNGIYLRDRANGCRGVYCLGRHMEKYAHLPSPTWEFWDGSQWTSAGKTYSRLESIVLRNELLGRMGAKTIIAGGRDYNPCPEDVAFLDSLPISEVVSGRAKGADQFGENWAAARGVPIKMFAADWDRWGNRGGVLRNIDMAKYADAAVLFTGGSGTLHMYRESRHRGLVIYDRRVLP